jgi:hypothetical protein
VRFDFRGSALALTRYELTPDNHGPTLANWEIEGSIDGAHWDELDSHAGEALRSNTMFEVTNKNRKAYQYIKIGTRRAAANVALRFCAVEFYGTLINHELCRVQK